MIGCQHPLLIEIQVLLGGLDEVEDFFSPEDVVPYRGATEIDVKVRVGVADTHKAVLLHFRPRDRPVLRPEVIGPAQLPSNVRGIDQGTHAATSKGQNFINVDSVTLETIANKRTAFLKIPN